jgi:hypothetical protein
VARPTVQKFFLLRAPPLAKKTASLIEKETLKKRITNIESSSGGL